MIRNAQLSNPVTITSLRKLSKTQLVSQAQQLQLEENGTKADLIGRLLAALNSGTGTHKLRQTAKQEDVDLLQAEVADLDLKLGALSVTLSETTAAREAERQQLTAIIADMGTMRDQWQHEVQQADALSSIAGQVEQSERDILTLCSQKTRFAERIALMQRLLKEREQELVSLTAQLSGVKQPVMALAGTAASSETSSVFGESQALFPATSASPSWANDWSSPPLWTTESSAPVIAAPAETHVAVPATAITGARREASSRQHKAPALAMVAALQKGGEAWDAVKSLLPQDTRFVADLVLAASATAAYVSLCN